MASRTSTSRKLRLVRSEKPAPKWAPAGLEYFAREIEEAARPLDCDHDRDAEGYTDTALALLQASRHLRDRAHELRGRVSERRGMLKNRELFLKARHADRDADLLDAEYQRMMWRKWIAYRQPGGRHEGMDAAV